MVESFPAHPLLVRNRLALPRSTNEKKRQISFCKLCDIADWESREFKELAAQIMGGEAVIHRKLWEFTQLIRALTHANVFHSQAAGLSVAAGSERVLYYLANHVGRIIATDLYGEGAFSDNEASDTMLKDPTAFAPYPYRKEALASIHMNGCELRFPDNSFDFAFSLSSLEHFGGIKNAKTCIQEMARVVRPGGVVFFTTDCSLNGFITDEVFRPSEIPLLLSDTPLSEIAPLDWDLSDTTLGHLIDMRRDPLDTLPHINLKHLPAVFTSISIAAIKQGEGQRTLTLEQIDTLTKTLRSEPIEQLLTPHRTVFKKACNKLRNAKWKAQEKLLKMGLL